MTATEDFLTQLKELHAELLDALRQPTGPAPARRTLTAYAYSDPGGETVARIQRGLELASDGQESRDLAATVPTAKALDEMVAASLRAINPPAAHPEIDARATGARRMVGNCYGDIPQPRENAALVWTRG